MNKASLPGIIALAFTTVLLVFPASLSADILWLKNGDRLSGTLKRMTDGTVTYETKYAGTVHIPRDVVGTIATETQVTVQFRNKVYLTGRLIYVPGGNYNQMSLRSREFSFETTKPFTLDSIKAIYQEDPRDRLREQLAVDLSGQVNLGVEFIQGNTDREKVRFDGQMQARTPRNRYFLSAEYNEEESDGEETEKNLRGFLKYDYFLSQRWFLFNSASFKKDDFEDIDLRTTLSAGTGYQFYERDDLNLFFETGLSYIDENFDRAPDESNFGLNYSINYDQKISWIKLFHLQEAIAGSDIDFIFQSKTGLQFPITSGFHLNTEFHFDWDADPPADVSSTDTEYLLTLGYGF